MKSVQPVLPNSRYNKAIVETTIAKDQPPYKPLHVARVQYSDGTISMISRYQLTWKERLRMFFRGELWCEQLTFGKPLQPQRCTTYEPLSGADIKSEPAMDLSQDKQKVGLTYQERLNNFKDTFGESFHKK